MTFQCFQTIYIVKQQHKAYNDWKDHLSNNYPEIWIIDLVPLYKPFWNIKIFLINKTIVFNLYLCLCGGRLPGFYLKNLLECIWSIRILRIMCFYLLDMFCNWSLFQNHLNLPFWVNFQNVYFNKLFIRFSKTFVSNFQILHYHILFWQYLLNWNDQIITKSPTL